MAKGVGVVEKTGRPADRRPAYFRRLVRHVVRAPILTAANRAKSAIDRIGASIENVPKPHAPADRTDPFGKLDHYFTAHDGAEVRYRFRQAKNSDPRAKTVALMCGFDTHPAVYLGNIPVLNETCNVFTMENRGHWKSSRGKSTPKTYIEDLARDLKAALDAEHATKAVIVAHSMWGAAAMRFCELFPDRVEGVVFIGPAFTDPRKLWIYGDPPWLKVVSEALFTFVQYNPFLDIARRRLEDKPFAWEIMKFIVFGTILEDAQIPEHALKLIKNVWRANTRTLGIAMRALFRLPENWEERCREIKVPVLIIAGKKDPLIHWRKLVEFSSAFSDVCLVLEESSMHFFMLSQPERFNKIVLEFMRVLKARDAGERGEHL